MYARLLSDSGLHYLVTVVQKPLGVLTVRNVNFKTRKDGGLQQEPRKGKSKSMFHVIAVFRHGTNFAESRSRKYSTGRVGRSRSAMPARSEVFEDICHIVELEHSFYVG